MIAALLLLTAGIILAFIGESRIEEEIIDEWTVTPSTLNPQSARDHVTGWAFMAKTEGGNFLELNVTASDDVRVRIGAVIGFNENTYEAFYETPLLFNETGTHFTQRVCINGTSANHLEIKNEGTKTVNISGNIKKIGNVPKTFYPYRGLGTLAALLGIPLLIYGTAAGQRKRKHLRPQRPHNKPQQLSRRCFYPSVIKVQSIPIIATLSLTLA